MSIIRRCDPCGSDWKAKIQELWAKYQNVVKTVQFNGRMNYPDGILVVVGHAGLNRAILADYMSLPLKDVLRIPQEYACSVFLENR